MINSTNVSQIYNVFINVTNELKPFIKVDDLAVVFDTKGNAYIQGKNFKEQLHADALLGRLVREEMLKILAQHRSLLTNNNLTQLEE